MLLATIILLCPLPQTGDLAKAVASLPVTESAAATKDSAPSQTLPSAPVAKVSTDAEAAADSQAHSLTSAATGPAAEGIEPGTPAASFQPVRPAYTKPGETTRQRVAWYALSVAGSGTAAFDAWSTRRAVSQHYGTEANPLLRPFSHSGMMYAATQVSPLFMDYIGKRMMVSQNPWLRRMWWLPQAAGSGFSIAAGVHNVGVVP